MDSPLKAQQKKLEAAERQLVLGLKTALATYDQQAACFGVPDGCPCPPCVFIRACRSMVGAYEDQHGPVVR